MPPSCQRFSSGGLLGKLVLPEALIFLAFRESPSNSVYLFKLRLHALSCCWLCCAGLSLRDIAPHWQRRTCGPWGKRTHRTRSSLSCRRSGKPNVQRSKSEAGQYFILIRKEAVTFFFADGLDTIPLYSTNSKTTPCQKQKSMSPQRKLAWEGCWSTGLVLDSWTQTFWSKTSVCSIRKENTQQCDVTRCAFIVFKNLVKWFQPFVSQSQIQ